MSITFVDLNREDYGDKMMSCRHRSRNKIEGQVASCCGNTKKATEYKCEKRDIFPLKKDHCDSCTQYES